MRDLLLTKRADTIKSTDQVINAVNGAREYWQCNERDDRTGVASSDNNTEHPVETCSKRRDSIIKLREIFHKQKNGEKLSITNEQTSRSFLRFTPRVFTFERQTVCKCPKHIPEHILDFTIIPDQMT